MILEVQTFSQIDTRRTFWNQSRSERKTFNEKPKNLGWKNFIKEKLIECSEEKSQ